MSNLSRRRRIQLGLVLGLMVLGAISEVISLGAILPFLAILVDPQRALQMPFIASIASTLNLDGEAELRFWLALVFAAAALLTGTVRFALTFATARLTYGIGHELAAELYRRALYQPYEVQVARNSSEVLGGISKVDQVVYALLSVLNLTSSVLISACIFLTLVVIEPVLTLAVLIGLGGTYSLVFLLARGRLQRNSDVLSKALDRRAQAVQEGLGSIRDILLDHAQEFFARRFRVIDWPIRQALATINIIGPSPRYAIEAAGMVLFALLAYHLVASPDGLVRAVPVLGALALGMQRLMPLVQQIYIGCVQLSGNRQLVFDVLDLLQQRMEEDPGSAVDPLRIEREIRFEDVSFRYAEGLPDVIQGFSLSIPKGARVGLVGTTGSGKSTATDLVMGLLSPTGGRILVDDRPLDSRGRLAWRRNIAHVPQTIYLADASFTENIAFGVPHSEVDMTRVRAAAEQAQIARVIESSALGYDTMVGERGFRLSGGERQRLGIARALYKQATVLVLDEATSALDNQTETAVIESIEALGRDITVVMVAHRLSTLRGCDMVVEIADGRLAGSERTSGELSANRAS